MQETKNFEKLPLAERRKLAEKAISQSKSISVELRRSDARDLSWIPDASVHLVVTSPPYWSLKKYNDHDDQMGNMQDYDQFLFELNKVVNECFRVLVPGGRLVCVVGDVCLSRKKFGRHMVVPLHSDITIQCREAGFDNLNPIFWYKIANAKYEVQGGSGFLGKPYEPNAIIKNDMEYILLQRKPGGYRSPTAEQRARSMIDQKNFQEWFRQVWTLPGASTRDHPAPYPTELAARLIQMFSFVDDIVLDPFAGTGTTLLAALLNNRNSIGCDIDPQYISYAQSRLKGESDLFSHIEFKF